MALATVSADRVRHPCFYARDRHAFGRIHLPVARSCNIQCGYCRRDHDCAHENRPGVTRQVMSPGEAVQYLEQALEAMPHICVAGIAGPGDAFCDPEATLETLGLIRKKFPDLSFCVSTNGLNISPYVEDLKALAVGFVTVTINALDPGIGSRLVKAVRLDGQTWAGDRGAAVLIRQQVDAVERLKSAGCRVKVNTVVVPGINDHHCLFIARRMAALGVDIMNLLPLMPLEGTDMAALHPPGPGLMERLRSAAGRSLPQMRHCRRCRADAVGCLD